MGPRSRDELLPWRLSSDMVTEGENTSLGWLKLFGGVVKYIYKAFLPPLNGVRMCLRRRICTRSYLFSQKLE